MSTIASLSEVCFVPLEGIEPSPAKPASSLRRSLCERASSLTAGFLVASCGLENALPCHGLRFPNLCFTRGMVPVHPQPPHSPPFRFRAALSSELQGHGRGGGIRTPVDGFGDRCTRPLYDTPKFSGSGSGVRTRDHTIMSRALYHLSYPAINLTHV